MPNPENSVYIIVGEMNIILAVMRKTNRWSAQVHQEEEQDSLVRNFSHLKDILLHVTEITDVKPHDFLSPFLDVIRSETTSGPVTGLALTAIHKFLSYGLIDTDSGTSAMESIADAVTHARFVGTDPSSDEVVLMKIMQVLRMLMLTPAGIALSNESVCEIMQSCFRICFEVRLTELLRKSAEHALTDMVQLLFSRLAQFSEDTKWISSKKLKMKPVQIDASKSSKRKKSPRTHHKKLHSHRPKEFIPLVSGEGAELASPTSENSEPLPHPESPINEQQASPDSSQSISKFEVKEYVDIVIEENSDVPQDFINSQGVHFTSLSEGPLVPHGLPCVRELFRFLVTLINPLDRHNSEVMIQIGLNLLTVALESGADNIGKFGSLLSLIKDETCRNLFSLLSTEKMTLFAATLRLSLLLFESLRTHLKFQLEMFLKALMDIIVSEAPKLQYEQREVALDFIVQFLKVPGLVTELYLNFDCDLYCSNLFEDLAKLLSKNAFPVSGLYSTHLLSLEALLAVVESIETHCNYRILSESHLLTEKSEDPSTTPHIEPQNKNLSTIIQLGPSGYFLSQYLASGMGDVSTPTTEKRPPYIKPNRMKPSENIPTHEELMAIKHKKKLLTAGTEHFNSHSSKGIAFLQEHGLLSDPLNPPEVATFLRDNPQIDKHMIGEYISNRKNLKVLEAFVRSFNFEDTRIDEALRQYLETFRLPGEAPLISLLMEHFADHWHTSNGSPFASNDAAFTLAYAVIMLNVDQHNHNVKRQNIPMNPEDFKKNLKKVNGGEDFDEDMLEEIYNTIKNDEIVMPAEQVGIVKENYMWKVLLRRGIGKDGAFKHASTGLFDHDLFSLIWGPIVAALSFVFDKSQDVEITKKAIGGFRKCAMISAHYGMSDVFDNLVISLCKFTGLLSSTESPENLAITFGTNNKGKLATKTMFNLAHRHGDILREGWKNLFDCVVQLYRAKLLPKSLLEGEDFVSPKGVVSLIRENQANNTRMDSSLLSSFYSYLYQQAGESTSQREAGDEAARTEAQDCIEDCHPDHLITESKFLRMDSLQELVKTLVFTCHTPDQSNSYTDEQSTVFVLEVLIKIVLQNRDRVTGIWPMVRDLLYSIMVESSVRDHQFLFERSVVGLLLIAIRLVRREEMIPQVIQSLHMLLLLKASALIRVSRQVASALHELLRTSATTIKGTEDWRVIFTLLECVGAGARSPRETHPQTPDSGAQSDSEITKHDSGVGSDRSYASDSEVYEPQQPPLTQRASSLDTAGSGWTLVSKEGEIEKIKAGANPYNIIYNRDLLPHDSQAFLKSCESLSFLVRDAAHITKENFESCVHCIRTFVEASLNGGLTPDRKDKRRNSQRKREDTKMKRSKSSPSHVAEGYEADNDDDRDSDLSPVYQQICFQLLDLMHTLHTRASSIFQTFYTEEELVEKQIPPPKENLWNICWCPLLQGIARLCCDVRRPIRTSALTFLQRALLVHDLQVLTPAEWENCFNKVLFPLLSKLLETINPSDPLGMEETRMRGATLLCKVFLQHLNPLLSLPTFTALWLTILDFMDKFMHADGSDLLGEAIPESLKNMLLVMDTAGIFNQSKDRKLWSITWDKINTFLPSLKSEVFKAATPNSKPQPGSTSTTIEIPIQNTNPIILPTSITPIPTPSVPLVVPKPHLVLAQVEQQQQPTSSPS